MKNIILASIAALLVTASTVPVIAAETTDTAVNTTSDTANVKVHGLKFLHARKKVALKVEPADANAQFDLDYGGENLPIIPAG